MIALKLIAEGLGLGFLLYLICAIGIRNGAVGMVHLYDPKVQERAVALGLMTAEEIRKRSFLFRSLCLPGRRYQLWESALHGFRSHPDPVSGRGTLRFPLCSARNRRRGRLGAQQEYMTGLGVSKMKGSYRLSEGKEEFVKAYEPSGTSIRSRH